ncbi:MAG: energy transducer TonB [Proteobacteria bacterium]|nr:energy transducer TonB [Pseudomonadota bacterium]
MKIAIAAAIAASLAASSLVVVPTRADESIVVKSGRPALPKWVKTITQQLDASLERAMYAPQANHIHVAGGYAAVSFTTDSQGKPVNAVVSRASGDSALDAVALTAVTNMKSLYPLPTAMPADQRFRANIIVAPDTTHLDRLIKIVRKEEAQRLRAEGPASHEFAISLGSSKSA